MVSDRLTTWWGARSQAERFDLYTRLSLYALASLEPFTALGVVAASPARQPAAVLALFALVIGHTVLCLLLTRAGLANYLGRRPRPTGLAVAAGALTLVGAGLGAVLLNAPGEGGGGAVGVGALPDGGIPLFGALDLGVEVGPERLGDPPGAPGAVP